MTALDAASAVAVRAAAVAAWGLPTMHRMPQEPLSDDVFRPLLAQCVRERIVGVLGAAVRADDFPVTDAQRAQVDATWQEWLGHALRVERLAAEVLDVLTAVGIPVCVLKGVALAHLAYPDPSWRVFGDLDLLVAPGHLHHAGEALVLVLDGHRAEPELRPGYDDRFGREVLVRMGAIEIDLHRTFVNGAYGLRVDRDGIFADAATLVVGGRDVRVLGAVDRAVHAAYAAALSDWPPRLVALRDLVQVLAHDQPDPDAVVDRARAWRGTAVLAAGITAAWQTLRLTDRPALLRWAEQHRPTRADRVLTAAHRGRARGYTSQLTSLAAIPGFADRAAFVRAIAWPSAEYRAARGLGSLALVSAAARRARHG